MYAVNEYYVEALSSPPPHTAPNAAASFGTAGVPGTSVPPLSETHLLHG